MSFIERLSKTRNKFLKTTIKKTKGISNLRCDKIISRWGLNKDSKKKFLSSYALKSKRWFEKFNKENHLFSFMDKLLKDDLLYLNISYIYFQIFSKRLKGFKHLNNLPVRGQRTRTNRKTQRRLSFDRYINLRLMVKTNNLFNLFLYKK